MSKDKSFIVFTIICYSIALLALISIFFIYSFGIPNFSNINEQRQFCNDQGGYAIEPHRQNYNQMICVFNVNNTAIEYVAEEIKNEEWAKHFGKQVGDYCFTCWDSFSCSHPHNDVLRAKGVHC